MLLNTLKLTLCCYCYITVSALHICSPDFSNFDCLLCSIVSVRNSSISFSFHCCTRWHLSRRHGWRAPWRAVEHSSLTSTSTDQCRVLTRPHGVPVPQIRTRWYACTLPLVSIFEIFAAGESIYLARPGKIFHGSMTINYMTRNAPSFACEGFNNFTILQQIPEKKLDKYYVIQDW